MVRTEAYTGNEPYIFVSYSHKDIQATALMQEMAANGYRFWYDEGIKSGRSWSEEISRRLKGSCQFLVFLSKNAVASENVKDEIHIAKKYKIDLQVVYLEQTQLDDGLELMLDRTQGILLYKFGDEGLRIRKLIQSLSPKAMETGRQQDNAARDAFLGHYHITGTIPTGMAMTELLVAVQKSTGTRVFIKHFSIAQSRYGDLVRKGAADELNVLKHLNKDNCPFVPTLIDCYEDSDDVYIVEKHLGENTLDKAIEAFDRTDAAALQQRCVAITINIAKALRYLHWGSLPVVHRDIKPSNIFLAAYNHVYIIDFGICLPYMNVKGKDVFALGTMGYAAPEQHKYAFVPDPRADIHALGATLLYMLTGNDPREFQFNPRKPLRRWDARLDPRLEEVILKMTAKEPQDRYADVDEVIVALENYRNTNVFGLIRAHIRSKQRIRAIKKVENTIAIPLSTSDVASILYSDDNDVTTVLSAEEVAVTQVKPQPIPASQPIPVPRPVPVRPQPVAPVTGVLPQGQDANNVEN